MKSTTNYPITELELKKQNDRLQEEWRSIVAKANPELSELFVSDGFYPYYTSQKEKILFIGRESLGLAGCNYIDVLLNAYREGTVGGRSLNSCKFHALVLSVAYGLLHGCPDYAVLPPAKEIGIDFAASMGISFAHMNISKLSNESEDWQADNNLISQFLDITSQHKENLWAKQIALLQPDVIIGMNLGGWYERIGKVSDFRQFGPTCLQKLTTAYGEYKLIDAYHFAAVNRWKEDNYDPIMTAFKASL